MGCPNDDRGERSRAEEARGGLGAEGERARRARGCRRSVGSKFKVQSSKFKVPPPIPRPPLAPAPARLGKLDHPACRRPGRSRGLFPDEWPGPPNPFLLVSKR